MSENRIFQYLHCRQCFNQKPATTSMQQWSRLEVGFTHEGIQVWCTRHDCNVLDLDFLGQKVAPYAPRH